jgi:hypothetical protein
MSRRGSLFWDADPARVDPEQHSRYVIERIMDFGTDDEIRWMCQAYPKEELRRVLELPRSPIHPKSRKFWKLMLA